MASRREEKAVARGEARAEAQIVRRLLMRLDAAQVADLLGRSREQIEAIAARGAESESSPLEPQV